MRASLRSPALHMSNAFSLLDELRGNDVLYELVVPMLRHHAQALVNMKMVSNEWYLALEASADWWSRIINNAYPFACCLPPSFQL